ncbi:mitochondrial chaperone BCS1 [Cavenderia fasciculata]|uniref:Mitochondrial chaperone BCS1 n=1 Tax=Cavenderia fasciculata TaxID=261658 RepID=F4PR29_CACFS|nr:mitochondrial chaperone BCS1 [Cavenderia fasciculata]EGG22086.1 mitochondrial chaperone BCS1 [Cavenderia fasciculata]|eukprot:XP_004359937.1 mitochondrial chaperone BCS1 [Cavenderia fasciculata]
MNRTFQLDTQSPTGNPIGGGANGGVPKGLLKYIPESVQPLFENPLFSAGFGLIGVGAAATFARKGFQSALINARRYCFVSVEVPSHDKSYHWLMEWLAKKKQKSTRHVSVETTLSHHESGDIVSTINFVPSVGSHYILYKGRVLHVERVREKNVVDMASGNLWQSITLTTMGFNRNIFKTLIQEAQEMSINHEEGKTVIYHTQGNEWRRFGHPRARRPLNSVILDDGLSDQIIQDVQKFLNNSQWYTQRGIPYRRGYLLYGPPGTGKSSFITALAGELKLSICILNLAGKNVSDSTLNQLLSSAPQRSIILLEDIDSAIDTNPHQLEEQQDANGNVVYQYQYNSKYNYTAPASNSSQLTFSGLLNALDGVAASEGRILFMTTNHLQKLDKTLIRPGRVDLTIHMGLATSYQINQMYLKFFPNHQAQADQFESLVASETVSPAQLQGHFMKYSEDPMDSINHIKELIK